MNYPIFLATLAIMLCSPAARAGLLGYWPLDETDGETAADAVGDNDASWQNAGLNLTWATGRVGGAAQLTDTGGAGANNYFQFQIPELIGANAITIAAWIDPEAQSSSGYNGVVMTRTFNGATNNSWGLAIEGAHLDSRVNGPGIDSADGLLAPTEGWVHIALVWDGTAGTHTQYVNGIETNSAGSIVGPIAGPDSGPWYIGYDDCCGNTRDFDGLIDEVAIWDEALAPDKIALLAGGTRPNELDSADSDGDGIPDDYENMFAFLDPGNAADAEVDEDDDGLTNLEEYKRGTDPEDTDSDGDNLSDGEEVSVHGTNPNSADSDGDGIEDGEEVSAGADGFITDPLLTDTDTDGFDDGDEITDGTDPTDANDPPPAPPMLIGHWPLDEETGTTAADLINGNDGIWQNDGGLNLEWTQGLIGGAAHLTDAGLDDYFRIETISQLINSNALTITAWIEPDENPGYNGIFMTRTIDGQTDNSWGVAYENTGAGPNHLDTRVDKASVDSASDTLPPDGGWFHVALVWDGTIGRHTQYINGEESGSSEGFLNRRILTSSGPWYIGYDDCCGGGRDFNGLIDDVGMWNQALTAEEIEEIYQDGLNGIGIGGPGTGPATRIDLSPDGDSLVIEWESKDGKLYNLRSEADPSTAEPLDWSIFESFQDMEASPPRNSLTIPLPADPERFFVIEEFNAPPVTIFSEDFENGQGEWTTGSDGASGTVWELGSPSNVGPAAAHSPDSCFGTNLSGNYEVDADIWLRSPVIDLTTAGGATLSYFQVADIEPTFDAGRVAILDATNDSEIAVIDDSVEGADTDWNLETHRLPAQVLGKSIKIEFRFTSDDFQSFAGWYLDDVTVTVP